MAIYEELFNQKTIKRLCKDVEVIQTQEDAANEWLEMLDSEKLKKEKKHYIDFAITVLQEILGYPIKSTEGMDHEEGNVEFVFSNNENKPILCIEAKGTQTKDLFAPQHRIKKEHETPIKQTWDYMGRLGLDYGICTNYKEFVLITKQFGYSKCHVFDFKSISKNPDKLKEFVGIFSKDRIIDKGFVEKLQKESIVEEREFTKEFYKLFHETRLMMVKAFQEKENVSRTEAVYYTQIFLNRLIFIFFVEDRGFIPDKQLFSDRILHLLDSGQFTEHSRKIFSDIKELFIAFDKGSRVLGVFGFNGSLFSGVTPEKIYFSDLRNPKFFSDVKQYSKLSKSTKLNEKASKIIKKHPDLNPIISNLLIMDSFDFNTEVNVNILGHIFEQSISDLEELKQEGISRRKKEGVYYTPEYITDYICKNTIIPYLSKSGETTIPELIKEYENNLDDLENKFKEIKILDPACGSGAFLVKAIDILLEIDKEIQGRKNNGDKTEGQLQLTHEWDENKEIRDIIENNIYGVDINHESIEITKLSLFLRLASSERKLLGLSKNIKVGNSLIVDKEVDSRAFVWENEFPEILNPLMKQQKFDVIIGNPPYIRQELFKEIKQSLKNSFQSYSSIADLYVYFIERGISLLKEKGMLSYIFPNKFMKTEYGKNLRQFLLNNVKIKLLYDFDDYPVFEDATTYPIILVTEKDHDTQQHKIRYSKLQNKKTLFPLQELQSTEHLIPQNQLTSESWIFTNPKTSKILTKIKENSVDLKDFVDNKIFRGISSGRNDVFIINQEQYDELITDNKAKQILKKIVTGSEVKRYRINFQNKYLLFIPWEYDLDYSRTIKEYLQSHKKKLEKRPEVKEGRFNWWTLSRYGSKNAKYLSKPKIIYPRITDQSNFCLDESGEMYLSDNNFFISSDSKSLLAILNSSLIFFFLKQISSTLQGGYRDFRRPYIEKIPISKNKQKFEQSLSSKAEQMLKLHAEFFDKSTKFQNRVISTFSLTKIPKKLESVINTTFNEFLTELSKYSTRKLTLNEQEEWEDYFNQRKKELTNIQNQIIELDEQIDNLIFDMYDISSDDRKIVLQNVEKEYRIQSLNSILEK